jgi:hypothetical protein
MVLKYFTPGRLMIDGAELNFQELRWSVRAKVKMAFREDDNVFQMPDAEPVYTRRDIYQGADTEQTLFILSYAEDERLSEVEIHACERIEVMNVSFGFNDDLEAIASALSDISELNILSEGEYIFKDLKLVISNKWKMGSEGDTLGYFYCGVDVSHLENGKDSANL